MKSEVKLTLGIYLLAFLCSIGFFLLKSIKVDENYIRPIDSQFSVVNGVRKHVDPDYIVYGFLPYWSLNEIKFLQLDKITDIAYFGLNITAEGNINKTTEEGYVDPGYNNWKNSEELDTLIANAKRYGVRVSLTVISHTTDTSNYFLNCTTCWPTLVDNLKEELDSKGLKDVNLNFEYADYTDESYANKYTALVDYINKELDEYYGESYVVVSTFADSAVKPRVTKVDDLGKVADALFIMAYDFHRPDSDNAGPVSPIGGKGVYAEYDISTMLEDYLARVPASKLIMGVPYYGYNWVVYPNGAYAERIPGNDDIGYSQSQTYDIIMDTILDEGITVQWDDLAKVPYFTYISPNTGSTRQVYFENKDSLKVKYQLIKQNGLAGAGIWALGYDGGYVDLWELLNTELISVSVKAR